jgi:hypothetical protein
MKVFCKAFLFFLVLFSCSRPGHNPAGAVFPFHSPALLSLHGHRDTISVLRIDTVCVGCRTWPGPQVKLNSLPLHIAKNELGFVRLRKDASCFEVGSCTQNIICNIPDNIWIYGIGPVKNAEYSAGIAYIIQVTDKNGKSWMGYLSYTVLDKKGF